ncbi:MAG: tRNA (N(6)-L-threonylcarbamoyladenosine(37)-C(2))-methylthiotransferase MtaB [Alphaproteobacteria bacterium]|nr:tRNA (N(6)-L-threonylcarbamoyladenosine(37)-C(2))-methylthiotransferase MtaB [Alphaproteobacteria bacterium]
MAEGRPRADDRTGGRELHGRAPRTVTLASEVAHGEAAVEVMTFGCRLNAYESEIVRSLAAEAKLAGTVIVNTCAVTAEAERQALQAIRRLRRERPQANIIVTGCAAQIDPDRFAAMPEVSRVIGNAEKLAPATWRALDESPRVRVADIMAVRETTPHLLSGFAEHTRVFLEIQQGCDHRCTFCIIPFGRGPSRSAAPATVANQVRHYVGRGGREIVLTGVDLTSWGRDLPGRPTLAALVQDILDAVPDLPRLRLSSLDPAAVDDDLLRLVEREPRLMPHIHLSIQAGDDLTLKRKKRRHTRADAVALCRRLRAARPDIALGADLITGFPTEDEAMFERSEALIDEAGLDFVHVFPFSARRGTPAARMPQMSADAIHERARRLRKAAAAAREQFLARQIGRTLSVLVEKSGRSGHAENFARVALDRTYPPNTIVAARIAADDGETLQATAE